MVVASEYSIDCEAYPSYASFLFVQVPIFLLGSTCEHLVSPKQVVPQVRPMIVHLFVFVVELKQQPFVKHIAFVAFARIAASVKVIEAIAFKRIDFVVVRTLVIGSQETLIVVAFHIVVASESSIRPMQIEGIMTKSLASFVAKVVVHQDQPELMLEILFKLSYGLIPCC